MATTRYSDDQHNKLGYDNGDGSITPFMLIQTTGQGNVPVAVQGTVPVSQTRSTTIVLTQASAAQTGSGNSGSLAVGSLIELAVDINVTVFTGGTAPNITFAVDRLGSDGIWYAIWTGTALTAAGAQSTSLGVGALTAAAFGDTVRLRWTFGGTVIATSITFSASIKGK